MNETQERNVQKQVRNCFVTGDFQHADFSTLRTTLSETALFCPLSALDRLDENQIANVEAIMIAQSRHDQISNTAIERLRIRMPLARLLIVQSAWCVGKRLPHEIVPGAIYLRASEWLDFFAEYVNVDRKQNRSIFDLPQTTNALDQHLFYADQPLTEHDWRLAIVAETFDTFDSLKIACQSLTAQTIWLDQNSVTDLSSEVDCLLFAATNIGGINFELLRFWHAQSAQTPLIVISNFPRTSDRLKIQAICHLPADKWELLEQPFRLSTLQRTIERITGLTCR
jgi:hypothetical protein